MLKPMARFLNSRQGQFVKMGSEQDRSVSFGPLGLVLVGFPPHDWAGVVAGALGPGAKPVPVVQLTAASLATLKLGELLEQLPVLAAASADDDGALLARLDEDVAVMYFSGVSDEQLRTLARAVASVSWGEYGVRPAVGKAVPPAVNKELAKLMDEIAGDHLEAISMQAQGR